MPREEYAEYAKYSFQYAYSVYSAYLLTYDAQNKALLDTLRLKKSNTTQDHICLLLHSSDWAYKISGCDAHFFMAICTQETAAIQSPGFCVHPAAMHL
jgi:hypothetical protein